jgi:hypothetical protein
MTKFWFSGQNDKISEMTSILDVCIIMKMINDHDLFIVQLLYDIWKKLYSVIISCYTIGILCVVCCTLGHIVD